MLSPLVFAIMLESGMSSELVDLRRIIEVGYCELAAKNATAEDWTRIEAAAQAHAAYAGRDRINKEDILAAAELALPHRLKKQPFQETELRFQELEQKLEAVQADLADTQEAEAASPAPGPISPVKKKSLATKQRLPARSPTGLL